MKIKEIISEYKTVIRSESKSFYDGLDHDAFELDNVMAMAIKLYGEDFVKNAENTNNVVVATNSVSSQFTTK